MKILVVLFSIYAWCEPLTVSLAALRPADKKFDKGTYFAVSLLSEHFKAALAEAERRAGRALQTRDESHLTVLTPPEFMRLSPELRQQLLKDLQALDWTKSQIKPLCIGHGEAEVKGHKEAAFFVVVEAAGIKKIREKYGLQDFYPHITLGFTKRDLHFEDGVRKDTSSCYAESQPVL